MVAPTTGMVQDDSDSNNISDERVNLIGHIEALTSAFDEFTIEIRGLRVELSEDRSDRRDLNINLSNVSVILERLQYELERQRLTVPIVESVVSAESEAELTAPPPVVEDNNTENTPNNVEDPPIDPLPNQVFQQPDRPFRIGDTVRILSRQRYGEIGRIDRFTTFRVVLLIPGVEQEVLRARHNLEHVEGILH